MKILHAAFMVTPVPGVVHQMQWELAAAAEHGLDWDARLFCRYNETPDGPLIVPAPMGVRRGGSRPAQLMASIHLHRAYFRWLMDVAPHYDAILMRYNTSDPLQAAFVRDAPAPVFPVHHTLEVPELRHSYPPGSRWIRTALERHAYGAASRSTRGIIAVTDEILRYERSRTRHPSKPGYIYPNGIHYPQNATASPRDERTDTPEILFVASHFARWHGLDLLLDSLARSKARFILHLVGTLNPEDQTRAIADSRVRLHGLLGSDQIQTLSQRCWLGLSSFALARKAMEQACTLKVREYLLNGLPVYANYCDVFPDDFIYYRTGPPDIEQILDYSRSTRSATRAEVAEAARPYISKSALLLGLHDWLQAQLAPAPNPHAGPNARRPEPTPWTTWTPSRPPGNS